MSVTMAEDGLSVKKRLCFANLKLISKLFEEQRGAHKLYKPEEVRRIVFQMNGEPSFTLEPGQEAFDEPTAFVST